MLVLVAWRGWKTVCAPQDRDRHQRPVNPGWRDRQTDRQLRGEPGRNLVQDTTSAALIGSRVLCVEGHKQKLSKHDHKTWQTSRRTQAGVLRGGALEILESFLEAPGSNRWLCTFAHSFSWVFSAKKKTKQRGTEAALLLVASHDPSLWPSPSLRPHETKTTFFTAKHLKANFPKRKKNKKQQLLGKEPCYLRRLQITKAIPLRVPMAAGLKQARKGTELPRLDHFAPSRHVWKDLKVHKINSRQILARPQVESTSPSFWEFIVHPLLSSGGSLEIKGLIDFPFAKLTKKTVLAIPWHDFIFF